ncbi:MAG TPA: Na+/H+ antiporter subunit E [Jatrophihabitans sp.]|nr:Na+/H+ antiporter subunit E [Jatrophihabitans sp.]
MSTGQYLHRAIAIGTWAYVVWLLITWTATAEQLIFGGTLALLCGLTLAPLGAAVAPWQLLAPRRLYWIVRLIGYAVVNIVRANVSLARRIWSPSLPIHSGMVVVWSTARTDGEIAATAVITSLIVDNQFVDLDRAKHLMQYHAVEVPDDDPAQHINAPVEDLIARVRRPR